MSALLKRWSNVFKIQLSTSEPIDGHTVYTDMEWAAYSYIGRLLAK